MKAFNIKLATFSFAALLLASCSDSNSDGSSTISQMNTNIVGSEITQSTNAQELASRVYNFKSTATTKSRAIDETNQSLFEGIISMPEEPTKALVEAEATDITTLDSWNHDLSNKKFYIPENKEIDFSGWWNLDGATIYVEKNAKLTWGSGPYTTTAKVVVLSDGKFETSLDNINQQTEIVCYGKFIFKGSHLYVSKGLYMKDDLDLSDKAFDGQGKAFIGGNLTAASLPNNSGMKLNVKKNCNIGSSDFRLSGGLMNVDGTLTVGSVDFNSGAKLYSGCAVVSSGTFNVNSGAEVHVSYLKAKDIIQSSGVKFVLKDQSLIECETYVDHNQGGNANADAQNAESILLGDNAQAVIKAEKFGFNHGGPIDESGTIKKYECFMFRTPGTNSKIVLDGKYYNENLDTEILPYFPGQQIYWVSDKENTSDVEIKPTSCNGNKGWTPEEPDKKPKDPIIPISVIESDHDHDISATCVQPYSDKMYMSYHTRGEGHGSCIEVFEPVNSNKQVNLLQYVYDKDGYVDWNHLMVYHEGDAKQIYVVGNHYKKAGVLGYIDIAQGGLLNTAPKTIVTEDGESKTIQPLNLLPLNANEKATDENCIVYDKKSKRFIVMTTKGYVTYDPETLNEIEKVDKPGKAKHVAIGDGKIVTLVFTEQAKYNEKTNPTEAVKESINAQLEIRNRDAKMSSDPILTIKTPAVLPHYGKNSIVVKNSKIYVCLGAAGLYCYDLNTGTELGHYQMPSPIIQDSKEGKVGAYKAYANGVYVGDDNKVYIAYGSYGIVVLKAGTLEAGAPETIAHKQEGKSANYITVYNGYIYVAYGQKRLQVYQLLDNGASSADVNTKQ